MTCSKWDVQLGTELGTGHWWNLWACGMFSGAHTHPISLWFEIYITHKGLQDHAMYYLTTPDTHKEWWTGGKGKTTASEQSSYKCYNVFISFCIWHYVPYYIVCICILHKAVPTRIKKYSFFYSIMLLGLLSFLSFWGSNSSPDSVWTSYSLMISSLTKNIVFVLVQRNKKHMFSSKRDCASVGSFPNFGRQLSDSSDDPKGDSFFHFTDTDLGQCHVSHWHIYGNNSLHKMCPWDTLATAMSTQCVSNWVDSSNGILSGT